LVLPFWYQLTRVVTEKGPLNRCVYVCVIASNWKYTMYLNTTRGWSNHSHGNIHKKLVTFGCTVQEMFMDRQTDTHRPLWTSTMQQKAPCWQSLRGNTTVQQIALSTKRKQHIANKTPLTLILNAHTAILQVCESTATWFSSFICSETELQWTTDRGGF